MRLNICIRLVAATTIVLAFWLAANPPPANAQAGSAVASPAASPEPAGCEGLTAYAASMLQLATERWASIQAQFGVDDPSLLVFLDSEDSAGVARFQEELVASLQAIEPPAFAVSWHQHQIDQAQALADVYRQAAAGPGALGAYVASWDALEALARAERSIYVEAKSRCSQFEQAWSAIALVDGVWEPPDSVVDYAECEGLQEYDSDLRLALGSTLANNPELVPPYLAFRTASDPWALPPEALLLVADMFEAIGREYEQIVPPEYASAYHATRIQNLELTVALIQEAAASGFDAAEQQWEDEIVAQQAQEQTEIEEASSVCAIFPEFAARQ